jgi:ankyrin repeat protein
MPNVQSSRLERDTPLHYAATRGMASIARSFCADPRTNLNAQNGMGLTPLLCAFKNHGIMEEESQSQVCNLEVAEVLLKRGASPMLADSANGRTLVHYAVERMDERLIELLRSHLDEKQLGQLVNQADYSGETPMRALEGMLELKQERKAQICLALITCGADASGHNTDEDEEAEGEEGK